MTDRGTLPTPSPRPVITLTPANLNALLHGYRVVTSDAIIVLDRPVRS